MRKLNGITINGEYLGNSVVINGMFRAICTISPVIMRDFVHIINKIEKLEEAVKIKNFNCGFNSIDIEFGNALSKGIASLYFKLKNGEPELTNYKLVFNNQEYSNIDKSASDNKSQMTNPNKTDKIGGETERQRRLRELKEKKLEQQKKLLEQKKQKIEELKKQRAEAERLKSLSPEERRQELLKKKKEELLKKKREAAMNKTAEISDSSVNQKIEKTETKLATENEAVNSAVSTAEDTKVPSLVPNKDDSNITNSIASSTTESISAGENPKPTVASTTPEPTNTIADNSDMNKTVINSDVSEEKQPAELPSDVNDSEADNKVINNAESISQETKDKESEPLTELPSEDYPESTESQENNIPDSESDRFDENTSVYGESDNENIENKDSNENINEFDDINYDDITDEELSQLEAELDNELSTDSMSYFDSEEAMLDAELNKLMQTTDQSQNLQGMYSNLAKELNEGLSQGLIQGLSQGLSEGLSQGLSQGLGALFGNGNQGGGFNPSSNLSENSMYTGDFKDTNTISSTSQNIAPNYGMIDELNNDAVMSARNEYSYDENSNLEDLSDLYSDFYTEKADEIEEVVAAAETNNTADKAQNAQSEIDALQAELEALKAETLQHTELMSKDEFLDKQKELEEAKEKKRRQRFRMVGSRERITASALEDGIFVSGKKFYKWGDKKILDF